jgi:hypothetical protein
MDANSVESNRPCADDVSQSGSPRLQNDAPAFTGALVQKLPGRAAKPVDLRHHDDIGIAELRHQLRQLRTVSASAADLLAIDRLGTGSLQRLDLAG